MKSRFVQVKQRKAFIRVPSRLCYQPQRVRGKVGTLIEVAIVVMVAVVLQRLSLLGKWGNRRRSPELKKRSWMSPDLWPDTLLILGAVLGLYQRVGKHVFKYDRGVCPHYLEPEINWPDITFITLMSGKEKHARLPKDAKLSIVPL